MLVDYKVDETKTQQRWRALTSFYKDRAVLPAPGFECAKLPACGPAFARRKGRPLPESTRGCAAYVGTCYDAREKLTNVEVRLVIIGIDQGRDATDLYGRRRGIVDLTRPDLNTQMRGVERILRVFFGEPDRNLGLFSYYAMPNALKCAGGAMQWNRPFEMFANCRGYLASEFKILEPNIVITQSRALAFEHFKAALESGGAEFELRARHPYADWWLMRHRTSGTDWQECHIVDSPHPRACGPFYGQFLPFFQAELARSIRRCLGLSS